MISIIIALIIASALCLLGYLKFEESYGTERTKPNNTLSYILVLLGVIVLVAGFALYPKTKVWQNQMVGKAALAEAEFNRQIVIREAEAKHEAAKHWAKAEVERAKGAAEANKIVARSLGGPEGYLRWLYIQMLEETDNNLIYIPTEAGLPILEAGKR